MTFYFMDDFGNAERDITVVTMATIRFTIDGRVEGIASGVLEGDLDDDSLKYFGLIQ